MSAALTAFFFVPPGSLARASGGADELRSGGGADERGGGGVELRAVAAAAGAGAGLAAGFSADPKIAPFLIGFWAMARTGG